MNSEAGVEGSTQGGLEKGLVGGPGGSSPPYPSAVTPPPSTSPSHNSSSAVLDLSSSGGNKSDYSINDTVVSDAQTNKSFISVKSGLFSSVPDNNMAESPKMENPLKSFQISLNNHSIKGDGKTRVNIGVGLSTIDTTSLSTIDSACIGTVSNKSVSPNKSNRVVTAHGTIIPPLASTPTHELNSSKMNKEITPSPPPPISNSPLNLQSTSPNRRAI